MLQLPLNQQNRPTLIHDQATTILPQNFQKPTSATNNHIVICPLNYTADMISYPKGNPVGFFPPVITPSTT